MSATQLHAGGVRAVPLHGALHISFGLAVPTGFACDPPGGAGAAHVCEHAVMAAAPPNLLGSLPVAAVTSCHHTTFTVDVPADEFNTALRAFAAIVRPDPALLERAVEQERRVVALELAMGWQSGGLGAAVAAHLAPQTGLGRERAATPHNVEKVPYADVLACAQTFYTPQAATLVLAGAVSSSQLDQAALLFPGGEADQPAPALPLATGPDTASEPATAWGIAVTRPPRGERPQAAWPDCLDEALIRPGSQADRLARSQGATPVGSAALRCPRGDLLLSAYRSPETGAQGPEAAACLHTAMLEEENLEKLVTTAVQSAARAHTARMSRVHLPWEARDVLLGHATGTGASWEHWQQPYDNRAALDDAATTLRNSVAWSL